MKLVTHTENLKKAAQILLSSAVVWFCFFSVASAEVIKSFDVDIEVKADSSLVITETIVYDFEGAQRHGIFRNVKDAHAQPASAWYKERYIDLDLVSVMRNGETEPYKIEAYDGLSVRIGDANKTITGEHTYQIVYRAYGALSQFGDLTEVYWNVTGNEWEVSILEIEVVVRTESEVSLSNEQYCYTGILKSSTGCDRKGFIPYGEDSYAIFGQGNLYPGLQLTIAQAVDLSQPPIVLERISWLWPVLIIIIAWLAGFGTWLYRWRFRFRTNQTIIAQYEPLADFRPMFTGVLFDNRLDSKDISAGIVYLAQQGFISIKQTSEKVLFLFETNDYEITVLRSFHELEKDSFRKILRLIFGADYPKTGTIIKLSEVSKNNIQKIANAKIIKSLNKAVVKRLVHLNFLEQKIKRDIKWVIVFIIFWSIGFFSGIFTLAPYIIKIPVLLFVAAAFAYILFASERRTKKGYEALNYLKGFKEFLSVTEEERYKFHNAPSLSPQQFMEYLPYAIAFGVEKEWAEVFKDIQIDTPSWYSSSTPGTHFNAAAFSGDIGSFSSSFSGSTGSSGSSGGGSSGGGSGGGGGGSW